MELSWAPHGLLELYRIKNNVANLTIPTYTPIPGNVFDGVAAENSELDLSNAKPLCLRIGTVLLAPNL